MANGKSQMGVDVKTEIGNGLGMHTVNRNYYSIKCYKSAEDMTLLWEENVKNQITTQGLNDLLTQYFKGSSYTASPAVGLVNNASFSTFALSDTSANITTTTPTGGTNGWSETTAYAESTRQALTLGTASGGSINNSSSAAVFTSNATTTLNGVFVSSSNTKGGTSGVLYGEVSFGSPQSVVSGNVITVTVTLTQTSA